MKTIIPAKTAEQMAEERAWESRAAIQHDRMRNDAKRLRSRLVASAERQRLEVVPMLQQFQLWGYFSWDITEMLGWPDPVIDQHAALLAEENRARFGRYP